MVANAFAIDSLKSFNAKPQQAAMRERADQQMAFNANPLPQPAQATAPAAVKPPC